MKLDLFGKMVIKDPVTNQTLFVSFDWQDTPTLRSAIYNAKQRGLKIKRLNPTKPLWFLGLSIVPYLWLHRLMSNGVRDWLVIMALYLVFGFIATNHLGIGRMILFLLPTIDGLMAFVPIYRKDKSGYINVLPQITQTCLNGRFLITFNPYLLQKFISPHNPHPYPV